jgi:plastocyanin
MKLPVILASAAVLLTVGTSSVGAQSAGSQPTVTIDNFAFAPAEVSLPAGTTVTWVNAQNVRHTATADNGVWDSGILANNQSFQVKLDQVGDFTYHCDIHPDMVGVVHVTAAVVADDSVARDAAPVEAPAPAPAPTAAPAPAPTPTPTSSYYGY